MRKQSIDVVVNKLKIRFEIPKKVTLITQDYRIGIGPIIKVQLSNDDPELLRELIKSADGYIIYVYT